MTDLGKQQAFPRESTGYLGMTYYQWLVGQALAGCLASGDYSMLEAANAAILAADDACERLNIEQQKEFEHHENKYSR